MLRSFVCFYTLFMILLGATTGYSESTTKPVAGAKDYADLVLTDANIYTVNPDQPWAQSVAIKGETIVYVGDNIGVQALVGPNTVSHRLDQKLVMPGLVDSHTHPGPTSIIDEVIMLPVDLDPQQIVAAVGEYASAHPDLKVIRGGEWGVTAFGPEGPNKSLLDQVVSDRAVILDDDSGHSQWMNSRALELMGIDKNTPDPMPGVSYFARDADGNPTGWSKEAALTPFLDKLDIPSAFSEQNLKAFLDYLSSLGVTMLYDASTGPDNIYAVLSKMDKEGTLPLRYYGTYSIRLPEDLPDAIDELKRLRKTYGGERLRFTTIKLFLDGVNEVGTSYVLAPFEHQPDSRGHTTFSPQHLQNLLLALHQEDIDLHIHTVGDAAVQMALNAVEVVQDRIGALNTRVTLAHVELISDADMARFKQLGVVANHTPHWDGGFFQGADVILGMERYNLMYRVQPLLDEGAVVAFSSDITTRKEWSDGRGSPFYGMQTAHNRQDPTGGEGAPIRSTERLKLEDMVRGYTYGGAYQLGREDQLGSIEVGKIADLVVLDKNLFKMDRYEIHQIVPQAVVMEGQLIHGSLSDSL